MATDVAEVQTTGQATDEACDWETKPQAEHEWLHTIIGEWTYETQCVAPNGETYKATGTMSVRSIGGLWVQGESNGEMPGGGEMTSFITLGYDPQAGKYVGTWFASNMGKLWVYDATREGNKLILASEGPSMTDENKTAMYHDIVEIISNDHHTLSAQVQNEDGSWFDMMTTDYRRKA